MITRVKHKGYILDLAQVRSIRALNIIHHEGGGAEGVNLIKNGGVVFPFPDLFSINFWVITSQNELSDIT